MGTGGPFPGGKARPGRDADHSPPSSAEVVNEQELYILFSPAPPWRVEGLLYFYVCSYMITHKLHFFNYLKTGRITGNYIGHKNVRPTFLLNFFSKHFSL